MTSTVPTARRPRSWGRDGSWVADVGLGLLLLAIGPNRFAHPHHWSELAVLVALVAPLLWRRRAPLLVFGVIAAVAFVQWLAFVPATADAALLVAFYSVAATSSLRPTLAAAAVLEVGVVLAILRYAPTHGDHVLAFVFLSGLVTAAGVLGVNVRVRRAYLREVEQRAARLELERDQQAQLATAAERARVAREMHDIVAHNLSVMVALTDGAALTLASDPPRAETALREASRAGRAALTDMRRVLGVLRDSGDSAERAPTPGLTDLDALLATVRHTGLHVRYETAGPVTDLAQGLQLSLFRIVQEAVTNTLKHAHAATTIDIGIRADPAGVEVTVRDDGGAGTAVAPPGSGHGIVGMRERAAVHRGEVEAGPTTTGWLVRARLRTDVPEPVAAATTA